MRMMPVMRGMLGMLSPKSGAAQQLLGKVGLLRAAAAAGAEQRAASAAPTDKRDRAVPGCAGPSTRSALPGAPALHLCRPSLHLPRSHHELLWHEEAGA